MPSLCCSEIFFSIPPPRSPPWLDELGFSDGEEQGYFFPPSPPQSCSTFHLQLHMLVSFPLNHLLNLTQRPPLSFVSTSSLCYFIAVVYWFIAVAMTSAPFLFHLSSRQNLVLPHPPFHHLPPSSFPTPSTSFPSGSLLTLTFQQAKPYWEDEPTLPAPMAFSPLSLLVFFVL